jgi:DNA-binding response OmpR family regulator
VLKQNFRILLVEDDPLQATLANAAITMAGFAPPTVVETALEALGQAADHDLVLLDVQLPDGNGLDVLRKLRERSSRPAVVIVTGHGAESIAVEALRHGADDYVSKDASFTDILPTVVERVRRSLALRDALESTERDVVEAERRSAVGEMTVALHHELNNPLMAALTEASLLRDEPGLSPSVRQGIAAIQTALERIRDTVKRAGEADGTRRTDYLTGTLKMADLEVVGATRGLRGRAIVAAEDRPMRRVISVLLRRVGFEPEPFDSIEEAVARLKQEPVPSVLVLAGLPTTDPDPFGVTTPGHQHSWALVVLSTPHTSGKLGLAADLLLTLPFDPATFATQVVAAVEAR